MNKLKMNLDALLGEMEPLTLDELNSLRGGYGGYYGYDTWNEFLAAADSGDIGAGEYHNVDASLPSGGASGGSGPSQSGGDNGPGYDYTVQKISGGQLIYIVDGYVIPWDGNGLCTFGAVAKVTGGDHSRKVELFMDYKRNGGIVAADPSHPGIDGHSNVVTGVATSNSMVSGLLNAAGKSNTILTNQTDRDAHLANGKEMIVGEGSDHTIILQSKLGNGAPGGPALDHYTYWDPVSETTGEIHKNDIDWSLSVGVN
ncbi:hypothetical protein [Pedobacter psychroterrae]|uniref:Uncharacterized protein n=1 Tax=Pedobacter psychroterrae TaxID=2530453 RepID=A0A4R0NM41_9SPHI|nr:hypothetical protein [Pedobacter psychroterrae]TCD01259.1 hypothetical protein EZ437_10920 [Pedobacter psychroterrae]